jgi:hypothetical protein
VLIRTTLQTTAEGLKSRGLLYNGKRIRFQSMGSESYTSANGAPQKNGEPQANPELELINLWIRGIPMSTTEAEIITAFSSRFKVNIKTHLINSVRVRNDKPRQELKLTLKRGPYLQHVRNDPKLTVHNDIVQITYNGDDFNKELAAQTVAGLYGLPPNSNDRQVYNYLVTENEIKGIKWVQTVKIGPTLIPTRAAAVTFFTKEQKEAACAKKLTRECTTLGRIQARMCFMCGSTAHSSVKCETYRQPKQNHPTNGQIHPPTRNHIVQGLSYSAAAGNKTPGTHNGARTEQPQPTAGAGGVPHNGQASRAQAHVEPKKREDQQENPQVNEQQNEVIRQVVKDVMGHYMEGFANYMGTKLDNMHVVYKALAEKVDSIPQPEGHHRTVPEQEYFRVVDEASTNVKRITAMEEAMNLQDKRIAELTAALMQEQTKTTNTQLASNAGNELLARYEKVIDEQTKRIEQLVSQQETQMQNHAKLEARICKQEGKLAKTLSELEYYQRVAKEADECRIVAEREEDETRKENQKLMTMLHEASTAITANRPPTPAHSKTEATIDLTENRLSAPAQSKPAAVIDLTKSPPTRSIATRATRAMSSTSSTRTRGNSPTPLPFQRQSRTKPLGRQ